MSVDQLSQGRKEEMAEVSNAAKTPQGPIQVRDASSMDTTRRLIPRSPQRDHGCISRVPRVVRCVHISTE